MHSEVQFSEKINNKQANLMGLCTLIMRTLFHFVHNCPFLSHGVNCTFRHDFFHKVNDNSGLFCNDFYCTIQLWVSVPLVYHKGVLFRLKK